MYIYPLVDKFIGNNARSPRTSQVTQLNLRSFFEFNHGLAIEMLIANKI